MKLTKEEKELIRKKREKEEEDKAKKVGYLKCDLYSYDTNDRNSDLSFVRESENGYWLANKKQVDKWITEFKNHFKIVLPKGTKFICYIIDGNEYWFDYINYGLENMDEDWAKNNLENIQNFKKL